MKGCSTCNQYFIFIFPVCECFIRCPGQKRDCWALALATCTHHRIIWNDSNSQVVVTKLVHFNSFKAFQFFLYIWLHPPSPAAVGCSTGRNQFRTILYQSLTSRQLKGEDSAQWKWDVQHGMSLVDLASFTFNSSSCHREKEADLFQ